MRIARNRLAAALPITAIVAIVSILGTGCGLGLTDNLVPDAGSPDIPPAKICFPNQAFGTPTEVPGFNDLSGAVFSVRFTPDELGVAISMLHGRQLDIYLSKRARRTDPINPPMVRAELNTTIDEEYPTMTADTLTIYFDRSQPGSHGLFVAARTDTISQFSDPVELVNLEMDGEGAPYVLSDGRALYFHTHRKGTFDIYRAQKDPSGFGLLGALTINTDADETAPVVSDDELEIYFSRQGDLNGGPDGIWMATRSSVDMDFASPAAIPNLNMPYRASPLWISPDGCRLYLQEQDPQTGYTTYVAERIH